MAEIVCRRQREQALLCILRNLQRLDKLAHAFGVDALTSRELLIEMHMKT